MKITAKFDKPEAGQYNLSVNDIITKAGVYHAKDRPEKERVIVFNDMDGKFRYCAVHVQSNGSLNGFYSELWTSNVFRRVEGERISLMIES